MTYQTINPATGLTVETYQEISDTDLEDVLATAQACYETDWRHRLVAGRARIVSGAATKLRENAEEYARYITLEMGKLIGTAQAEVALSADILDYYATHAEAFLNPRAIHESPGAYTNIFASLNQIGRVIEDSRVRGVTVTGSERAGAAVAERAGRNLKKSVMELGGSDPFVVLEDAPLETSIDASIFGRMFNTGQSCVSSKRIIVIGKERGRAFLDGFVQRMAALEAGNPEEPATTLGPISSERAMDLLLKQIDVEKAGGARVVLGGGRIDRPSFYIDRAHGSYRH